MELEILYRWLNFVIFLGALVYFLREPVRDFLGDRREKIRRELEEVAAKLKEVELRLENCRKKLSASDQKIKELREEFLTEGELEKENLLKKRQSYAEKIREDAKKMGEQELSKARHRLRKRTLQLAVDLAREILQKSVEPKDQERLALWGIESLEKRGYEGTRLS